jgi:hypothetical protein
VTAPTGWFATLMLVPLLGIAARPADAQPRPEAYPLSMRAQAKPRARLCPELDDRALKRCERAVLEQDGEYVSARRLRTAGIVVASVGGGLGAGIALSTVLLAAVGAGMSEGLGGHDSFSDAYKIGWVRGLAIVGGITAAISLAVGLPMAVSGSRRVSAARRRLIDLEPAVDVLSGGAVVGARWTF